MEPLALFEHDEFELTPALLAEVKAAKDPRHTQAWHRLRSYCIRRFTPICVECLQPIDLRLSGRHPQGPSVDHRTPVSVRPDLAFDLANIRGLAHLACNGRRGNAHRATLGDGRPALGERWEALWD